MNSVTNVAQSGHSLSHLQVITLCIFILVSIILFHGVGLRWCSKFFNYNWQNESLQSSYFESHFVLSTTIAMLVVLHMVEVLLWVIPIYFLGLISPFIDSYLYVMGNYTTIGSDVTVPKGERLLAPMIAISGMFTFGWTAGLLASIMTQFGKRDSNVVKIKRAKFLSFLHRNLKSDIKTDIKKDEGASEM